MLCVLSVYVCVYVCVWAAVIVWYSALLFLLILCMSHHVSLKYWSCWAKKIMMMMMMMMYVLNWGNIISELSGSDKLTTSLFVYTKTDRKRWWADSRQRTKCHMTNKHGLILLLNKHYCVLSNSGLSNATSKRPKFV